MPGIIVKPLVHEKIIKEALSRVGVANMKQKILWPSFYLTLNEDGDYIIAHFKELFPMLTGGSDNSSERDLKRRDAVVGMLEGHGMIEVISDCEKNFWHLFVLKRDDKPNWTIEHKINLKTLNRVEAEHIKS
jgi:hypothetical protein